jgi:hypothetical protein
LRVRFEKTANVNSLLRNGFQGEESVQERVQVEKEKAIFLTEDVEGGKIPENGAIWQSSPRKSSDD